MICKCAHYYSRKVENLIDKKGNSQRKEMAQIIRTILDCEGPIRRCAFFFRNKKHRTGVVGDVLTIPPTRFTHGVASGRTAIVDPRMLRADYHTQPSFRVEVNQG